MKKFHLQKSHIKASKAIIRIFGLLILFCSQQSCAQTSSAKKTDSRDKSAFTFPDTFLLARKNISARTLDSLKDKVRYPINKDTSLKIKPLDKNDNGGFMSYSRFKGDFKGMLTYCFAADEGLDTVIYYKKQKRVVLKAHGGETGVESNFYYETGSFPFTFFYYKYHDIYQSLFRYSEVNEIEILVGGQPGTEFPASGDFAPVVPNNVMKKEWYKRNVNYWKVFDDNDKSIFQDQKTFTVKEDAIMPALKKYPRKGKK